MAAAKKPSEPKAAAKKPSEPKAAAKRPSGRTVLAPLVQAKVGNRILHFYKGDVLPEGVDEESLENLISLGFVSDTAPDESGADDE